MSEPKNFFDDFSSKIKRVIIELPSFTFFHSPSDINKLDSRFIGRKNIINRIVTIFSNQESKSGAYLITGYRGMGKTSVLNQALAKISSTHKPLIKTHRLFKILVLISLLSIAIKKISLDAENPFSPTYIILILLPAWLILVIYLDRIINGKKKYLTNKVPPGKRFRRLITLDFSEKPHNRSQQWFQDVFLVITFQIVSLIIREVFDASDIQYYRINLILFITILILYGIPLIVKLARKESRSEAKSQIIGYIENYFRYSRNIIIKINLGHDVLKEIDILRIIARNVKNKYESYRYSVRNRIIWIIFILLSVYLITKATYSLPTIVTLRDIVKNEMQANLFIPSQNVSLNNYPGIEGLILTELDSLDQFSYRSYIYTCYYIDQYLHQFPEDSTIDSNSIKKEVTAVSWNFKDLVNSSPSDSVAAQDPFYNKVSSLSGINYLLCKWGSYLDISINIVYNEIQKYLNGLFFFGSSVVPVKIDYFFVLSFILVFWILNTVIFSVRYFGNVSQRKILAKLEFLLDVIDSQVTTNSQTETKFGPVSRFSFKFGKGKNKRYPIASINDIEQGLIEVFNDIESLPSYTLKPEFILIFDELDKIEPKSELFEEKERDPAFQNLSSNLFAIDSSRKRQHAIYKLLSNMKYFLTTAKAKFIFIAGREMYDAYLGDVSDRNFFNRSIFNSVIYVTSFLSEEINSEEEDFVDITGLTENYVCQFLFPEDERPEYPSLKTYNRYLIKKFDEYADSRHTSDAEAFVRRQKREKVIFLLHQFIIYLMHTSNGAPKKITSTFEKFVIDGNQVIDLVENKGDCLIASSNKENLHLYFDQPTQYTIGMMSSIINPIIFSIAYKVHNYGDKLLVAVTFLIDHIFKFHNYGFSWRNLEHTPEVIEIHKTPEFREFMTIIIQFLTQTHIEEIVSGLYNFKFPKRISKEIAYISKISEETAAAFNFTLDDQLLIKQHYIDQLKILETRYKSIYSGQKRDDLIHSIASLHIILGDIYFYEEDLGNAITEYLDGIQFMKKTDVKVMTVYQFFTWVRSMLKLGLAFEKRKTYDSAFLTYGRLSSEIVKFRDIDLEELDLNLTRYNDDESKNKLGFEINDGYELDHEIHHRFSKGEIACERVTKEDIKVNREDLTDYLSRNITPEKESVIFKLTAFEGIRLIYQPYLAKLQLIEKGNLGGITREDLIRLEGEFEFLHKIVKVEEKYLIETEFWNKVGDILFYKNGLIQVRTNRIYDACKKNYICSDSQTKDQGNCKLCENNPLRNCEYNRLVALKDGRKIPCISCKYYDRSLNVLINHFINWNDPVMQQYLIENTESGHKDIIENVYRDLREERDIIEEDYVRSANKIIIEIIAKAKNNTNGNHPKLVELFIDSKASRDRIYLKLFLKSLIYNTFVSQRKNSFKTLAGLLSDIGDVRICCANSSDKLSMNVLTCISEIVSERFNKYRKDPKKEKKLFTVLSDLNKLEAALFYYYLSAIFYKKAKELKNYAFQIIKMMHLFREYTIWQPEGKLERRNEISQILDTWEQQVCPKVLRADFGAYENIHTYMTERYRDIFNIEQSKDHLYRSNNRFLSDYQSLKKLPIDTEIEELVFLFYHLKLLCSTGPAKENEVKKLFKYNLASPYLIENNMFNRVLKLRFKETLNYEVLRLFDFNIEFKKAIDIDFLNELALLFSKEPEQNGKKESKNGSIPVDVDYYFKTLKRRGKSTESKNKISEYDRVQLINLLEFLISDSIYSLLEVLNSCNVFGQAFIFTHSYLAETHLYLTRWIQLYYNYSIFTELVLGKEKGRGDFVYRRIRKLIENSNRFKNDEERRISIDDLEKIFSKKDFIEISSKKEIGIEKKIYRNILAENKQFISVVYQAERAVKEYYSAIETHSEGKAYQNLLENMYYLNDDFNDRLFHFRLTQERYRMNIGRISKNLAHAKESCGNTSLFQLENYLKTYYVKKGD